MGWCENNRIDYVLGLARNTRLEDALARPLVQAAALYAQTGRAARLFRDSRYRTVDSWSRARRVVGPFDKLRMRGRIHERGPQPPVCRDLTVAFPLGRSRAV